MNNEQFLIPEENQQALAEKLSLSRDLVNESQVGEGTKIEMLRVLQEYLENWQKHYGSLYDAVHWTISQLLDIYKKDTNQLEAKALFENIRDDLWTLVRN